MSSRRKIATSSHRVASLSPRPIRPAVFPAAKQLSLRSLIERASTRLDSTRLDSRRMKRTDVRKHPGETYPRFLSRLRTNASSLCLPSILSSSRPLRSRSPLLFLLLFLPLRPSIFTGNNHRRTKSFALGATSPYKIDEVQRGGGGKETRGERERARPARQYYHRGSLKPSVNK